MKLSARSRYAARILLELAKHKELTPVSATILSQRTGVSVQFVEQILKPLKQVGFTASQRGATGGHMLAKPASAITLAQIVELMEGGICLSICCDDKILDCPRMSGCSTRKAWVSVSESLEDALAAISLADLLNDETGCSQPVKGKEAAKDSAEEKSVPKVKSRGSAVKKNRVITPRKLKGLMKRA